LAGVALAILPGCLVPPMSNVQTARLVDRGAARLAPFYSHVEERGSDTIDGDAEVLGGLVGVRIDEEAELQFRFERTQLPDDAESQNFLAVGPKFRLAGSDNAAILIPVGLYLDSGPKALDTVQIMPGMILSRPFGRYVEPIVSGRLVFPFKSDIDKFGIVTAGASLSTSPERWAVIPEVGVAWNLSDDSAMARLVNAGVAVTFFPRSE
jgi:hypothetical protein